MWIAEIEKEMKGFILLYLKESLRIWTQIVFPFLYFNCILQDIQYKMEIYLFEFYQQIFINLINSYYNQYD